MLSLIKSMAGICIAGILLFPMPSNSQPDAPILTHPLNGSTMLAIEGVGWLKVSGISSYVLQVSTTSTFSTTVISQGPQNFNYLNLKPSTLFYWRVEAVDPAGSKWSSIWSFTTCDSTHIEKHNHVILNAAYLGSPMGISYDYTIVLHPTSILYSNGWSVRKGLSISPEIGSGGGKIALGYCAYFFYYPPLDTSPSWVYKHPSAYSARIAYMHIWNKPNDDLHSQDLFGIEGQFGASIFALKSGYFVCSTNPKYGAWEICFGIEW